MDSKANSTPNPTRSQLLLVLDRADFGVAERKRQWVLHDLLLKVARGLDEGTGLASVYLTQKDRHTLADPELGPKFQRVWAQASTGGRNATFALNTTFAAQVQRRLQQATAQREANLRKQNAPEHPGKR